MAARKTRLFTDKAFSSEAPTTFLTERTVHQYAEALIMVHGTGAPYFAVMHALARRESGEPEGWNLWLAVSLATEKILAQGSGETLH